MARHVDIKELQDRFDDFIEEVETGQTFVITQNGQPIAKLQPPEKRAVDKSHRIKIGKFRDQIKIADDFDELPEEFKKIVGED